MKNPILEKLENDVRLYPEKTAFSEYGGASYTYTQLRDTAYAFAYAVSRTPAVKDAPVAILAGRSPAAIAAMLGAIAAGRWYVAIDAELPAERIGAMLELCAPSCVISDTVLGGYPHIQLSEAPACAPCGFTAADRDTSLPMFGIFTSGSTGMPKLVVKSADAMLSFTEAYCRTFGFGPDEIFGNQIPLFFDASTKDVYSSIWLGASCVMIPAKTFAFPINLVSVLNECRITSIVWVPSALSSAARFNVFAQALPEYLKNVLFVGERMPVKYLNAWMQALPGVRFVNLYGSTEVAGNSCYYTVPGPQEADSILPIGRPFDGTQVFIINPETQLPAAEGELCIAGPGLADGYYRDPEKTAGVFRRLDIPGFSGRVYFSGDFGRTDGDGNLVCISRRDSQIKHMGHRIELGEIESTAGAVSFVGEACCRYDAENEKIILYFSSDADKSRELRRELASKLPKYELPHKFVWLQSLPHNRNGKIDRAALKNL